MTERNLEQHEKEEAELDKMMNAFFHNMGAEEAPIDSNGVNVPLTQVGVQDEPDVTEESEPLNKVVEEEEEEVFHIHGDGQITTEAKESGDIDIQGKLPQSPMERAIYNQAINNIYDEMEMYADLAKDNYDLFRQSSITAAVLNPSLAALEDELRNIRRAFQATKFSRFKKVPLDDIDLEVIEDKNLREAVDKEVERLITNMLGENK